MRCPECGFADSKVIDSRPTDGKIRRRRECLECKCRFTTYEIVENVPLMVVKKDHSIEPFNAEKLVERIRRATIKRPVSLETIESMVDDIESELKNNLQKEVSSAQIGDMVLEKLKSTDVVAYIRFASVYKEFTDAQSFISMISELE
ncbi:MAG: transcriptional repressor NrdR [Ruminiclostridium sp.]|nr:transcriptional repressor NrdR [Ruminiclostridium sp.]